VGCNDELTQGKLKQGAATWSPPLRHFYAFDLGAATAMRDLGLVRICWKYNEIWTSLSVQFTSWRWYGFRGHRLWVGTPVYHCYETDKMLRVNKCVGNACVKHRTLSLKKERKLLRD